MPYSSDYIKRMIEQFSEFLLGIQRMAEGRQYGEALEQIDDLGVAQAHARVRRRPCRRRRRLGS